MSQPLLLTLTRQIDELLCADMKGTMYMILNYFMRST